MGCSPGMAAAHHIYTTHSNRDHCIDFFHIVLGVIVTTRLQE
jgi:hypothetical protein